LDILILVLALAVVAAGIFWPIWLMRYASRGRQPGGVPPTYLPEARCNTSIMIGHRRVQWPLGQLVVTDGGIAGWGPAHMNQFQVGIADVRELRVLRRRSGVVVTDTAGRSIRLRGPDVVSTFERVYATASRLVAD
jgi:hypothetical protein